MSERSDKYLRAVLGNAVYLTGKGWFWVVTVGQRGIYYGPYKNKEMAEERGPQEHQKS